MFSLDELEFRLLEEIEANDPPKNAASKLGALIRQVEVRMEESIPNKFEVKSFGEAKTLFQKRKRELVKDPKKLKVTVAA